MVAGNWATWALEDRAGDEHATFKDVYDDDDDVDGYVGMHGP